LTKLLPKVWWLPFLGTQCTIDPNGTPITEYGVQSYHMGSHSVVCYPTQVNLSCFNLSQVLDLHNLEGWKAELT